MAYTVGDSVKGVVSGVMAYGAFVRLEDGSTGMIHISKLSKEYVSDINAVIKKGDEVTATVVSITDGKIALSLVGDSKKRSEPPKYSEFKSRSKEPQDFESMLSAFKSASDEKLAGLNRSERKKKR